MAPPPNRPNRPAIRPGLRALEAMRWHFTSFKTSSPSSPEQNHTPSFKPRRTDVCWMWRGVAKLRLVFAPLCLFVSVYFGSVFSACRSCFSIRWLPNSEQTSESACLKRHARLTLDNMKPFIGQHVSSLSPRSCLVSHVISHLQRSLSWLPRW